MNSDPTPALPIWVDREAYPFTPKRFTVSAGALSYVDEGSGEPLVMVHGNPSWSFEYREMIRQFSTSHRCIAPDHIGFGLSDKPADWDYLPEQHAANLDQLLESLDLSDVTLVVGDWGGPIGLSYAINYPERIKNVIITNTWMWSARSDWYYQVFSGFVGGPAGRWLIQRHNFFAKTVLKSVYGDKSKLTPEIHEQYLMPLAAPGERKGNWVFPRQIIASSGWLASLWSRSGALDGKIKLIAWGLKDIAFREKELNQWVQRFPDVPVVRYEDAGHFLTEERSNELIDEVARVLHTS